VFIQPAAAQSKAAPRINQVMPLGGKPGATVELAVTAQDADDVEGLHFSFAGAKVEVLGAEKASDPKGKGGGRTPQATTVQKFKVALPTNIPLGIHDLRMVTKHGISNPRAFVIGDQTEVGEKEPNNDVAEAQKVELNTAVSGVISQPSDVDYARFQGKKGQRVVVACLASSVDSKLPAFVQVYSESGQYLGFSRNYSNNDAVVDCILPADGAYLVRLCSFTYTQGGADYFYRLSVTTAPWIDAVFPHIIEPGKDAKVTVLGRNLPGGALDVKLIVEDRPMEKAAAGLKAPADAMALQRLAFRGLIVPTSSALDGFEFTMKNPAGVSNPVLINYARAPVAVDDDANDTLEKPQTVQAPCEIAGRIDKKGDRDFFRFAAKKGQVLSIEVFADRLGTAMDTLFTLYDGKGESLTTQDDVQEQLQPYFLARSDDPPRYRFSVPADGTYTLMVTSKEAFLAYGPRYIYTARIAPEEPDFRVIAMPTATQTPDAVTLGQAGHQAFTLHVQRLGGFGGDITVTGDKLPPGVSFKPQVIAGNQKLAAIAVGAAPEAPPYVGPITLLATALINGKKVSREVRAATITWPVNQQNTPTLTRLDRELVVAVRDKAPYVLSVTKDKIVAPQGDRITVPVKLTAGAADFKTNVQLTAVVAPTGMAMQPVTLTLGKEGTATLDSKTTVLPGNYTLVLRGQTQPPQPNQQPKPGGPRNIVQTAPPIALTIVPKQLVKVSLPQGNVKLAPGGTASVAVKVARIFEYAGLFKIDLDPKTAKGITVDPVTLKAGDDEAKLTLRAAKDLQAGMNLNLTVRVTAMFNETVPVVHEAKLNVAIAK
jgi:hypothetical protein